MTTTLAFTKMHGLGNDFVVIDARRGTPASEIHDDDWPSVARAMCDRHLGIGADQLLLVCDSTRAAVMMRLFNTDGFEAEMCGNGIRCIGKYVYERGIVTSREMSIETLGGIKQLNLCVADGRVTEVTVAMGVPRVIFADERVTLPELASPLQLTGVDMGNPHAVCFLAQPVADFPLERIGPLVERHALFPRRTNFEIVNVVDGALRVRVWERSAGITQACGTGACASLVAARLRGFVDGDAEVHLPGGTLHIAWDGEGEVYMRGPATEVFDGTFPLCAAQ